MTTFQEDCEPINPHELEYPRLYDELRSLLERYGSSNVQEALDNIYDEKA